MPLSSEHVAHAGAVAAHDHAGNRERPRERPVAARGDRLRAPADPLAALEDLPDEWVGLELLERVVDGEGRVRVVEPRDEADADLVLAHRVDEAAAELVPLRALAKRPAHRVDDAIQGLLHLPDLLHAELPALRLEAVELEEVHGGAGQVTLCPLGQHRRLRDHVRAGLEVPELLAVSPAALVPGAHALDDALLNEELVRRGLGQQVGPRLLGLLAEEPAQLRDRGDVVAVVAEVGRRRLQRDRVPLGQQVDGVLLTSW